MGLCNLSFSATFISVSPVNYDDANNEIHIFCNKVESDEILKDIPDEMIAEYVNKNIQRLLPFLEIKQ